jgi:translocation and assembly module TamB
VVIDLDLTKNLKARGEAGQDGSGKLGITYEREY